MSDLSNEASYISTQRSCECYKKLATYGIPFYKSEENEYYGESQKKINFENAFQLPGVLTINENITQYLFVEDSELSNVFHHMAEIIPNLLDFEQNLLSFWILDMFIEGLWTAQNANMNFDHQKATLYWIAYMFNYIQKENPTRKNLFDHLTAVLLHVDCKKKAPEDPVEGESTEVESDRREMARHDASVNWKEKKIWKLPLPPNTEKKQKELRDEIKISSSEEDDEDEGKSTNGSLEGEKYCQDSKNKNVNDSLTSLTHMKVILEILYRIFGRFWVYLEIQTVFHAMPPVKQVDLPFTLPTPKPLLKTDISASLRSDKSGRKLSYSEKSIEEVESEKQLHKNDFILPLQFADESKVILKQYFPPPSSQRSILGRKKT